MIVEQRLRKDDETTATQLHELLVHNGLFLCTLFFAGGNSWGGHFGGLFTVNYYESKTNKKGLNGC